MVQGPLGQKTLALKDVMPVYPSRNGVQFLRFSDGGTCEIPGSPELLATLIQAGVPIKKESAVAALLHGNWHATTAALAFLMGIVLAFYLWLLPLLANFVSGQIPVDAQRKIGEVTLRQLEGHMLAPSKLTTAQQDAIQTRFASLAANTSEHQRRGLQLLIRMSNSGPNAFALPGNFVLLTDELVRLVDGDLDAISGVLAHELGHLSHRHVLRSMVQATSLTILGSALIGDYSSALAAVPAALGHLRYSRQFEAEADIYSRTLLCSSGVDPAKTSLFFERAAKASEDVDNLVPIYLKSHPSSTDRAAYFRKPCSTP